MPEVRVRVVEGDAMRVASDVLVLKFAQSLHGLDRAVADRLSVAWERLPAVGEDLVLPGAGQVAADRVVFLGVEPLVDFGYEEIRGFGRRAVEAAGALGAAEITMTVHGPGYGLDEREAFSSQLAGVIDAVSADATATSLTTVTFVDHGSRRAESLAATLAQTVPSGMLRVGATGAQAGVAPTEAERMSTVGFDSGAKQHVFAAMPFAPEFEDVFAFAITPAAHAAGLLAERMDKISFTGDIVAHMRRRISGARLLVADVTGANPNVYLEVGFAWGNGIPTVLVCRDIDELQFDVRGHRCLSYTNLVELNRKLTAEVAALATRV